MGKHGTGCLHTDYSPAQRDLAFCSSWACFLTYFTSSSLERESSWRGGLEQRDAAAGIRGQNADSTCVLLPPGLAGVEVANGGDFASLWPALESAAAGVCGDGESVGRGASPSLGGDFVPSFVPPDLEA